jgi:hypothetical protein
VTAAPWYMREIRARNLPDRQRRTPLAQAQARGYGAMARLLQIKHFLQEL